MVKAHHTFSNLVNVVSVELQLLLKAETSITEEDKKTISENLSLLSLLAENYKKPNLSVNFIEKLILLPKILHNFLMRFPSESELSQSVLPIIEACMWEMFNRNKTNYRRGLNLTIIEEALVFLFPRAAKTEECLNIEVDIVDDESLTGKLQRHCLLLKNNPNEKELDHKGIILWYTIQLTGGNINEKDDIARICIPVSVYSDL